MLKPRCRILLLVDKISKATDAQAVLNRIGAVLDSFGNVGVVDSSLSPHLIYSLATVSQRWITYVAPQPLLRTDLGRNKAMSWANEFETLSSCQVSMKLNILRNSYLLCSGHPVSLECIATAFAPQSQLAKRYLRI